MSRGTALTTIENAHRGGLVRRVGQLTRVPSGYDKDHPRADLLRYKTLTAHREVGCPDWLATQKAKSEIAKLWRGFAPLTSWLETNVGRN